MEIDSLDQKTKKDLTVFVKDDYSSKNYKIYEKTGSKYIVPLVYGIQNFKKPVSFPPVSRCDFPKIKCELRESQVDCVDKMLSECKKTNGGGIISLQTGAGKTICSLYVISKVKVKTLIIVNTSELLRQWVLSINQFLPGVTVGKIQATIFDPKDITVATVQTLCKKYTKEDLKSFSMCFIDEVHHLSGESFSKSLFKISARYTFGLSATVSRKDGLEYVFKYHIGDILHENSASTKQETILKVIDYYPEYKEILCYGKPNNSANLTLISEDTKRSAVIIETLLSLGSNRRVLVLSDRVSLLVYLHSILGSQISGLFTGKTTVDDKNVSRDKKIMLATYQIASEGFDHPVLNTLLLATPRSNITQSIGRIYRKRHQIQPMIIDIVDHFSIFPYQYKKRKALYKNQINKSEDEERCLFD